MAKPQAFVTWFEELLGEYYETRGLRRPAPEEALLWLVTEVGEAADEWMRIDKDWVRNNPQPDYSPERFGSELGDVMLMAMVAGLADGVSPLEMLLEKMGKHVEGLHERDID